MKKFPISPSQERSTWTELLARTVWPRVEGANAMSADESIREGAWRTRCRRGCPGCSRGTCSPTNPKGRNHQKNRDVVASLVALIGICLVALIVVTVLLSRNDMSACYPIYDDGDRGSYTIPDYGH